jgi:hypothetical protein
MKWGEPEMGHANTKFRVNYFIAMPLAYKSESVRSCFDLILKQIKK